MKPSSNTIGLLIFIVIATTAFVYMAKRPAIEGNAISFGMPIKNTESTTQAPKETNTESQMDSAPSEIDTATEENIPAQEETTETDSQTEPPTESIPITEPEPTTTN